MASGDSAGNSGKALRHPAKQKAAGKAQKAGNGKAKIGRIKQAASGRTTGREGGEEGAEGVADGQKGSRKGKVATADRQKQKPAKAKPASQSNKADKEEQSATSSGLLSSPVSVTKNPPARPGRKALNDNAAEQDDDGDDAEAATEAATAATAHSPKKNKITGVKGVGKAGLKAASKGKKGAFQAQQKEAKAKQLSTRQQPR